MQAPIVRSLFMPKAPETIVLQRFQVCIFFPYTRNSRQKPCFKAAYMQIYLIFGECAVKTHYRLTIITYCKVLRCRFG